MSTNVSGHDAGRPAHYRLSGSAGSAAQQIAAAIWPSVLLLWTFSWHQIASHSGSTLYKGRPGPAAATTCPKAAAASDFVKCRFSQSERLLRYLNFTLNIVV